jgi:hypothetical protein
MIMIRRGILFSVLAALTVSPLSAQDEGGGGSGEVVVTASRYSAPYAQQNRPVIGLRRQADGAVMSLSINSDSREEATRKSEIHAMLLSAIDRAAAAGLELVSGSYWLVPVTKSNYKDLPFFGAGRVDTSQVVLLVKTKLSGSALATAERLTGFIKSVPKSGRGAISANGSMTLTIINPDQYRDAIIKMVADNSRKYAAMFGADYAVQVNGIDGQILWSQVSSTEVFLYVPYTYIIVPK